jgi:hypothetical protein
MASTYLTRTPSSAGSTQTGTISFWVKKSSTENQYLYMVDDGSNQFALRFNNDKIMVFHFNGSTYDFDLYTTALFRDVSGWYNIVLKIDTTNATAIERFKLYVNNEYIAWNTTIAQNFNGVFFKNSSTNIGATTTPNSYFDGLMSHFHLIDGTAYEPTAFGEYDANGVWKIKTSPSVTYGTNGFFILKDGNSVTDQSGNGNNFTVAGGTLTNTEDSPSNVFATWNPLDVNGMTLTQGNLTANSTGATWKSTRSTLGMSSGKWYWEVKIIGGNTPIDGQIGVGAFTIPIASYINFASANPSVVYDAGSGDKILNGTSSSYGSSYTIGDIIGVAFDADNLTVEFFKNGISQGVISTGWSSDTYACEIAFYGRGGGTTNGSANFGNGYFGTTAVASAGTNASGIGIFEYDVPTGYTALSTKGLNL